MKIVICSAGRRAYLVKWFKDAFARLQVPGEVWVTDASPDAPAVAFADQFVQVPPYSDPHYDAAMTDVVRRAQPDLLFSVNDYELHRWSQGLAVLLETPRTRVLSLTGDAHRMVHDKFAMASFLSRNGIDTPPTFLLSDDDGVASLANLAREVVVKARFGSGSNFITTGSSVGIRSQVASAITASAGSFMLDELIVQPLVRGVEFGVDAVRDPMRRQKETAVLARQKLQMRSGETDKAITVDASRFAPSASRVAELLDAPGLIDMDFIVTPEGELSLIDVNPRFGGGYPFMHAAGARVPDYYVASVAGIAPPTGWSRYTVGARGAKYDFVASVGSE